MMKKRSEENQIFHDIMMKSIRNTSEDLSAEELKDFEALFEAAYRQLEADGTFARIDAEMDRFFGPPRVNFRLIK